MNLAFVGVGVMGNPMCMNLLQSGLYAISAYDIDATLIDNLEQQGARRANSVADAVGSADIVMTSLPGPKQIEKVAFDEGGLLDSIRKGAVWIDLSTNNLDVCHRIVARSRELEIDYLDCPVSGGDEGAKAGSLTILAGGDFEVFQTYHPVLSVIGNSVTHLGENGAGYSAKIAQVILCYLHSLALSEALMLGIKGGVNPAEMLSIIQNSTGKSYVADRYGPPILRGDYDPSFTIGLAHKDMKLAKEMADNLGIELPMCELTTRTYEQAVEAYGFDENHLKVVRLLEEKNKTFLRG